METVARILLAVLIATGALVVVLIYFMRRLKQAARDCLQPQTDPTSPGRTL